RFWIIILDGVLVGRLLGELIVNLGLVSLLIFARLAAKEDAAIEVLSIADAIQLQDEIVPLADRLQIAGAVFDVEPAFLGDTEGRFPAGEFFPAGEVFAVEEGLGADWLEPDVAEDNAVASESYMATARLANCLAATAKCGYQSS